MKPMSLLVLSVLVVPQVVLAGANARGTLILHANPELTMTEGITNFCGYSDLAACSLAVTSVPLEAEVVTVFYAIAAFPDSSSPRLAGITFGIDYDPDQFVMMGSGKCGDFELTDHDWPGPGTGTSLTWNSAQTGRLVDVYWFAGYSYCYPEPEPSDSTRFELIPHPSKGGDFADDATPAVIDTIAAYGRLGFGVPGWLPCTGGEDQAGDGEELDGGGDASQGDEGGGDGLDLAGRRILYPSTDHNPFEKIDIYADRTDTLRVQDHQAAPGYPDSLNNTNLIVVRYHPPVTPGDTLAAMHSFAKDFTLIDSRATEPGYVQYQVDPPRFASSVDLLAMGLYLFDDVSTFDDRGHPILKVTTTHEGGGSYVDTLKVGNNMRNYRSGTSCYAQLYYLRPTDPLSGQFCSVPFGGSYWYYDVHEIVIPAALRNKRMTGIRLDSIYEWAWCAGPPTLNLYAGERINGISVDSKFHIVTAGGDSVVTQRQDSTAWATQPYGGLMYNGELIGTWRTIGELGCFLTCVSMASNFYGVPCDPELLNRSAEDNWWYDTTLLAVVDTAGGQGLGARVDFTVTHNWTDAYDASDRLVLRHNNGGQYDPVAIIRPVPPYTGAHRSGVVDRRFASLDSVIVRGDQLECYGFLSDWAAFFGGGSAYRLETVVASDSNAVTRIEEAMVNDCPVLVHTFVDSGAVHWVLADGMKTHWDSSGVHDHRGTYRIHDPGSDSQDLFATPYSNRMSDAKIARPMSPRTGEDRRLVITVAGNGALGITDPIGHTLRWDPEIGGYESNIEGLAITQGFSLAGLGDSQPSTVVDRAEIDAPVEGDYLVQVTEVGGEGFTLHVGAHDGPASYRTRGVLSESGGVDGYYLVSYVADADSILGWTELDPAGVIAGGQQQPGARLTVSPNPATRTCDIELDLASAEHVTIGVFDVAGRSIATVVDASLPAGTQRFRWDGKTRWGSNAPSGVYLVCLQGVRTKSTQRLVYIR